MWSKAASFPGSHSSLLGALHVIKSCLLPRLPFFITWCTPCDLIPRLPGSHSSTLIILGALHVMKVTSFPDSYSQPQSQIQFPASLSDSCSQPHSQPHSQTGAPSFIPRLVLPASFPGSCSQIHSQTHAPSLIPRLVLPASFTGPIFHCLQSCRLSWLLYSSISEYNFWQKISISADKRMLSVPHF